MARNAGIAISSSRFACLKIEDDEDAVAQSKPKPTTQAQSNAAKKRNKKKKEQKDNEQLKQLAFGGKGGGGSAKGRQQSAGDGGDQKQSWDQWKSHDKELMEEQFKDDLQKALLQSRLETEQKQQEKAAQKERIEAGIEPPANREARKKKKQKEKPQPMSLEQFKQLPAEKVVNSSDESDGEVNGNESESLQTRVPATQQDPRFFNSVDDDAEQILRQEKMQEEYRKHYASDNAIVAKLKNDLESKDLKMKEVVEKMSAMEAELKQVKKRNKQFCVILAQGEMKDKAQVLLQVDELTIVRDELTEQVTSLTADLEKEKSKNRALKGEIDKLKNNKHGK